MDPVKIPTNTPGYLFLASRSIVNSLQKHEISYLVSVTNISKINSVNHDIIDIGDTRDPENVEILRELLPGILEKIHIELCSGKNVGVHCNAGVSRSPTVVIAYLMKFCNMTFAESFNHVQIYRPSINPNPLFISFLQQL